MGIKCSQCGRKMKCLETRRTKRGITRRQGCECGHRSTSVEVEVEAAGPGHIAKTKTAVQIEEAMAQIAEGYAALSRAEKILLGIKS